MAFLDPNELLKQQKNEETTKLQLITPVIQTKWQSSDKIVMEYKYTAGRISIDEYNVAHRGKEKKVDYLLLWKDNILLALVEAKGQDHSADDGYSQAVDYAADLDVPFAYATNGIELIEKDMITGINRHMKLDDFPGPDDLWARYLHEKGLNSDVQAIIEYPYYQTIGGKKPRYYQRIAINRTIEHIAKGNKRALLVMATGTGKTFTAFQIIYRFWKLRKAKKILFLADRNILVDQTMRKDFAPFLSAMVKFDNDKIDTSKDVYLALYQQLKAKDTDYYKKFPRDFFDLIVIDAYGIIGLNSKDSINKGFSGISPILFSPQKRLTVELRRCHAQIKDFSAKRPAAGMHSSIAGSIIPFCVLQRQSNELSSDVDLHRSSLWNQKDVSLACTA